MKSAATLLNWYKRHGRDLPWRHTRDPYKILVSEIMLQQTQVNRVIDYYHAWLKRFPNWKRLAEASNAEVISAWAGLGYNRRALMLRDIARQVSAHGVPESIEGWESIKGIGPYTARAISAFAQKKRTLPIDTNIRRVLARLLLGIPYPDLKIDPELAEAAEDFLPRRGHFYEVPQAIFDLATMICTKTPDCASCPLQKNCKAAKAFLAGTVETPKAMIKKATESRHRNKKHPDRIYRGRILKLVREEPGIPIKNVGQRIDHSFDTVLDTEWLLRMLERMKQDQLIVEKRQALHLSDA